MGIRFESLRQGMEIVFISTSNGQYLNLMGGRKKVLLDGRKLEIGLELKEFGSLEFRSFYPLWVGDPYWVDFWTVRGPE